MAIDPLMYEKYSGRKGDPMMRMGAALAKDVKAQHERDEMPKGVEGGMKMTRMPGIWSQIFFWLKDKKRGN